VTETEIVSLHPSPWLPLLQQLTIVSDEWAVWKNADFALAGDGDIDSVAPIHEWAKIEREFRGWAKELDLGPVARCPHLGGGMELIAVPRGATEFLELGAKAKRFFRGSTLYRAEDFMPLMEVDPRGFRRLRPGAEGLFKLVLQGFRWSGAPNRPAIKEKHVLELIRSDPGGVEAAAELFGVARAAVLAAAQSAAAGDWDRPALLFVQGRQLAGGLLSPRNVIRRAEFRLVGKRRCAITRVLFDSDRRIPLDREAWLHEVQKNHVLYS
jgi:hypothetical protein